MLRRNRVSNSSLARSAFMHSSSKSRKSNDSYIAKLSKSTKPPSQVPKDEKDEYK